MFKQHVQPGSLSYPFHLLGGKGKQGRIGILNLTSHFSCRTISGSCSASDLTNAIICDIQQGGASSYVDSLGYPNSLEVPVAENERDR